MQVQYSAALYAAARLVKSGVQQRSGERAYSCFEVNHVMKKATRVLKCANLMGIQFPKAGGKIREWQSKDRESAVRYEAHSQLLSLH